MWRRSLACCPASGAYSKQSAQYQTREWDRRSQTKAKIEAPIKVVEYLANKTQKLIKARINAPTTDADLLFEKQLADKIEKQGVAALGAMELEMVSASRSLAAFRVVGMGLRLIAGPVGLVLGGCEVVIQWGEMGHAMQSGDPGGRQSAWRSTRGRRPHYCNCRSRSAWP